MKKIDKLITQGFLPPYIIAFLIAQFVLIMQFLWKYIDEMMGKGVGASIILELLFYFGVTLIPLAIPVSILIASVLVFGDLAEKFELTSFKSSGVSLLRIMRAGIVISILTAMFSFFASNFLKPKANLKFYNRFYSIRKQDATLNIEKNVFNNDFNNMVMKIGDKAGDGRGVKDVLIYDHSDTDKSKINMIVAKSGEMYVTEDGNYFMLDLADGVQYMDVKGKKKKDNEKGIAYPFSRTTFKSYQKILDMSEFDLNANSLDLNRKKEDLLNSWQLSSEIDSLQKQKADYLEFPLMAFLKEKENQTKETNETTIESTKKTNTNKGIFNKKFDQAQKDQKKLDSIEAQKTKSIANINDKPKPRVRDKKIKSQLPSFEFKEDATSILDMYKGGVDRVMRNTMISVSKQVNLFKNTSSKIQRLDKTMNIFTLRKHQQFSWALVCIIFLFIGAPLGSIIRKGGYGYPLLVAVIFFMMFIIFQIMGEKLVKGNSISPIIAAWLPCLILFPFAVTITYLALVDAKPSIKNLRIFQYFLKDKETT